MLRFAAHALKTALWPTEKMKVKTDAPSDGKVIELFQPSQPKATPAKSATRPEGPGFLYMDYSNDRHSNEARRLKKPHYIMAGLILVILLGIAVYFGIHRPRVVPVPDGAGIRVANEGRLSARIFRVDTFWYWESQVGFIADFPPVNQLVPPAQGAERLDIPEIPAPDRVLTRVLTDGGPYFMKIVIRYEIPHIVIFRYRTNIYFRYDRENQKWLMIDTIPARYRSLGNLGRGDVEIIELNPE